MTTIKIQDKYYKAWINYENCMTPYPEDPIYSAELQRKIIQKVAINYQNLNEASIISARTKMYLTIGGLIILALFLLFSTDFGKNLLSGGGKEVAVTTIKTAATIVKANTTQAVNTGILVT